MTDLTTFPDIEKVLGSVLEDLVGGSTHIGNTTPVNLQESLPYIRVMRIGGVDDLVTDVATVAIDAFAAVRDDALSLAGSIQQRLISGPNVVAGVTVDETRSVVGPHEVPWSAAADPNMHRFTASYRVSARRSRS